MNPDLQHLIQLQQLDTAAEEARRQLAEEPNQQRVLDERLAAARARLDAARAQLTEGQLARRELDKSLAAVQGRLSKFKDQLMEVKTNREYQAMQHEIATAQHEVGAIEDKVLEHMLAADEIGAAVKEAEQQLKRDETEIDASRRELGQQMERVSKVLDDATARRTALLPSLPPALLATFETIARRRGIAVTEARQGLCGICNVRLRPQVFNEIRRNDAIIQCDSCSRILYFAAPTDESASS
jgi:predicted  nucleic acid-binding Zn-ribbon protein